MFRVQKVERKYCTKTIRLSEQLVERIEGVCEREGVGVNELIRQCIEYALGELGDMEGEDGEQVSCRESRN
jgi:metal-responsive CopG/Arc/MetJ family transcriptional regulator